MLVCPVDVGLAGAVVVVVVVELPQTPKDDPQRCWSCTLLMVDGLITVGAWVQSVIAMVCGAGAGMEVVAGRHAG